MSNIPAPFLTNVGKLRKGYWPWTRGVRSRFPIHYKRRFALKFMTPPKAVHYKHDARKYSFDEFGARSTVVNIPIPIIYPKECNEGLWGGEGIVKGYTKRKNKDFKPVSPRIWIPNLMKRVFYSDILERWMSINVTDTTLDAIDESYGFDHYILSTPEQDLRSNLGMRLKREMLLTLCEVESLSEERRRVLTDNYSKYIVPKEEAEWVGLTLAEAEDKQTDLEQAEVKIIPHKLHIYEDYLKSLENNTLEETSPEAKPSDWKSKLSPFK